jgi:microcin C transport system substrate-binding protein
MQTTRTLLLVSLVSIALGVAGCGKSTPDTAAAVTAATPSVSLTGMEADLQRTLKEQSDFYHFKTSADLLNDTKGLVWEDGSDLAEFADPAAKKGGTLTLWLPDFPGTFRAIGPNATSVFRDYLLDYVAMTFVRPHPNVPGHFYPQLARSWAVDRSSKTVYFRLDPEARWSDGVPFTTDDVVFSWYYYRSLNLNEPWFNDFYTKTYRSITVYDAHTFAVTLQELKPDIVDRAGDVDPFPRHFFKDFGPGWEQRYDWRICPTLGAYTIREEDVKRTTSVTLSHVKDWWGENKRFTRGRYNPDRIRLSVVRDPDKAFESFVHGDLDIFALETQQLWFSKLPDTHPSVTSGFTVKTTFYNQIPRPDFGLWINEAKPGLDNLDVRLGIQYASNMDLVCREYFRGTANVQKTTSDGYGWDLNPAVGPRPFDPVKAREYFSKAGYSQQGPDGVLVNAQGQRLSFTITTIYRRYQDVLVILKQEALKAGLEFNVEVLDETTGWQKIQEKKHEIAFAAFSRTPEMYPRYWETFSGVNAYDVPYLPDGSPNPARKAKSNTNNLCSIADIQLDRLIKDYDKADNMDEVRALAAKIEQIIHDNACWVNGWSLPYYRLAYRPWIKWPKDFNAMQSLDFKNFWLMWIDPDVQRDALAAKAEGRSLPVQIVTYDKFKEKKP